MQNLILITIVFIAVLLVSLGMTAIIRRYSLRKRMLDIPNERSSHSQPTPRGGGVSITIIFILSSFIIHSLDLITTNHLLALSGGGLLVGLIGWLDDHYDIPVFWRAAIYLLAAGWAVFWAGGMPVFHLGELEFQLSIYGMVPAIVAIAWLTNLYNFMDGTDALAAIEAISTAVFASVLFYLEAQTGYALLCIVLVLATTGFLYWNLPPARIFMGDVGSCVIGFVFGTLALIGENTGTLSIAIWIILLAVFIYDASFTLIMRVIRRERWYSAHRSHAYQRLVQMGMSHGQLALSVLFINVVFLWPLAWLVYVTPEATVVILLVLSIIMMGIWGSIQMRFSRTGNGRKNETG